MDEKYRACFARGRPVHAGDRFAREHPPMDPRRRAKLFMPFDALDGFGDAIAARQKITRPPPALTDEAKEELARRLLLLEKMLRAGERIMVTVVFFHPEPSAATTSDSGTRGVFRETSGMLTRVDSLSRSLRVVEMTIGFDDIYRLSSSSLPDQT